MPNSDRDRVQIGRKLRRSLEFIRNRGPASMTPENAAWQASTQVHQAQIKQVGQGQIPSSGTHIQPPNHMQQIRIRCHHSIRGCSSSLRQSYCREYVTVWNSRRQHLGRCPRSRRWIVTHQKGIGKPPGRRSRNQEGGMGLTRRRQNMLLETVGHSTTSIQDRISVGQAGQQAT